MIFILKGFFFKKGFILIKPFSPNFKLPDQVTHSSEILYTFNFLCFFLPSLVPKHILNKERIMIPKFQKLWMFQKAGETHWVSTTL